MPRWSMSVLAPWPRTSRLSSNGASARSKTAVVVSSPTGTVQRVGRLAEVVSMSVSGILLRPGRVTGINPSLGGPTRGPAPAAVRRAAKTWLLRAGMADRHAGETPALPGGYPVRVARIKGDADGPDRGR